MLVGICGAEGQMGRVLSGLYREERPEDELLLISRDGAAHLEDAPVPDVLIDFSEKDALEPLLTWCLGEKIPVVLAVTGYDEAAKERIEAAARSIPVFQSANLSLGVHVLRTLVRQAARLLGEDADIELIERHHRKKKDAPSGTALLLLDEVKKERSVTKVTSGREGQSLRESGEVGVHAVRGGSIVGEHTLLFALESEVIELTHRGESKKLFAKGAMKAADFIREQAPGYYTMEDLFQTKAEGTE